MRILIHSDEYYPTAQACSYRMKVFADTFVEQGHEVVVIASSTNKNNGVIGKYRERIYYSPAIRMKKKTTLMRMLNNISFGVTSIFTSLKVGKIDVVITTSPPPLVSIPGWVISKIKKARLIYDVRDIWPDVALEMGSFSEDSLFCKCFTIICQFMYKHSDWITTVSPGKVEKIKEHLLPLKKNKYHKDMNKVKLVENGFDESILQSEIDLDIVKKYSLDQKPTCLYVGNIGLAQGLESLLEIAAHTRHKDVQFLLFGAGAEKDKLEKRARTEKLDNVKFCGIIPHEKVFTLLSYAKLSYIPLKNSNMKDSIPTKVYEALGVGCPVLLVAEGDSCKIVHKVKMGKSLSPDDIKRLPMVFDEMIDNYEKYVLQRDNVREIMCNKYSRQQIAKKFEKELCKLIEIDKKGELKW